MIPPGGAAPLYAELAARYRTEAKALLRSLDTGLAPLRKTAEKKLVARLKAEGISVEPRAARKTEGSDEVAESPDAGATPPPDEEAGEDDTGAPEGEVTAGDAPAELSAPCAKCGTTNDADASFCKRCGARLAAEGAS